MANQEFFIQRPSVTPTIYVYNLPQVTTHKGYVKVGYTDRDAETRINEQMHTSGLTANILYWRKDIHLPGCLQAGLPENEGRVIYAGNIQ